MATKVMMFIFLLICFLLIAQPSLQLSPFRFSVKAPFQAVGWIFIFLGITCISYNQRKEAQAEEHEKINRIIKDFIEQKKEEERNAGTIK